MIERIIPSSGETLPVIGLGTWQSFDVPKNDYEKRTEVLEKLQHCGGSLIDSSPMYGRSEKVIGELSSKLAFQNELFYATKVWTTGREAGIRQMNESFQKMQRTRMDLLQIHNLVDWKTHLPVLREWKETGKIRYIGITHYTDSMHGELENIMSQEKIDFVQFNYSIENRHAEKRLLSAASHYGVATLINRPFGEGKLFNKIKNKSLPPWSAEFGIKSWGAFFLKFILAQPAVTCIIPATSNPQHAFENFEAGSEPFPDQVTSKRMLDFFGKI